MSDINIRELREEDLNDVANLVVRLKRFNSEHDPLFSVTADLERKVLEYLSSAIRLDTRDVLVAEADGKIVGMIMGEIVERHFYEPLKELMVTEIYILPEFRKKGLGKKLMDSLIQKEKSKGCGIVTVEFPTENLLAHKFYSGQGMRSIISVYGKKI
ncbi:MAG: GNAT family N-acetyltransferase [Thermoplasmatales archaeon]